MKNTVILNNQKEVYLIVEARGGSVDLHSAWSKKEKAEETVYILNFDESQRYSIITINVDDELSVFAGYEVLININSGEQTENELVSMNQRCVCDYSDDPTPIEHNFLFRIEASIPGESPRKINGKWYVQEEETEKSWEDFLKAPDYERFLDECTINAYGVTKEEALAKARAYRIEVLAELETRNEWKLDNV